jgi:hypothetical protein
MIAASMLKIAQKGEIPFIANTMPYFSIQEYQQNIPALLADSTKFKSYERSYGSVEKQFWWLQGLPVPRGMTLSDRVEQRIINLLAKEGSSISKHALDKTICRHFPGLLTPKKELVEICLQTYAEADPEDPDRWHINPINFKETRNEKTQKIANHIVEIGSRLEFCIRQDFYIDWCRIDTGETLHRFFIIPTAMISLIIYGEEENEDFRKYIVFPGSVSKLIAYKLDSDPVLRAKLNGWILLKNRTINRFAIKQDLTYPDWEEMIYADPPQHEEPSQISIFD